MLHINIYTIPRYNKDKDIRATAKVFISALSCKQCLRRSGRFEGFFSFCMYFIGMKTLKLIYIVLGMMAFCCWNHDRNIFNYLQKKIYMLSKHWSFLNPIWKEKKGSLGILGFFIFWKNKITYMFRKTLIFSSA